MSRPNVLVFMTDQQHFSTIGRNSLCHTPNIDKLIDKGVIFNNAFCPSPICTPSRTSFQTGLFPHQHKMMHNAHHGKNLHIRDDMSENVVTLGRTFSDDGYKTAYIGKWDSGIKNGPPEHGYEYFEHPGAPVRPESFLDVVHIPDVPEEMRTVISAVTNESPENTEPFKVADRVCSHIEQFSKGKDKPFYIFSTTVSPHVPWICPKEYVDMYPDDKLDPWTSFDDDFKDKPSGYLRHYNKQNYCRINDWDMTAKALSCYFGMISLIDAAFGRIYDCLEQNELLDNTVIVFTSDHGEHMGEHSLIGKDDNLLDSIIRVPLVISFPRHFEQSSCDSFVNLTDIYATLLEITGSDKEAPSSSRSLLPLLKGQSSDKFPDKVFLEHNGANFLNFVRGVRTKEYKYVFRPHETDEFYDLRIDSNEMVNRINDSKYAEIIAGLKRDIAEWMTGTDDIATVSAKYLLL